MKRLIGFTFVIFIGFLTLWIVLFFDQEPSEMTDADPIDTKIADADYVEQSQPVQMKPKTDEFAILMIMKDLERQFSDEAMRVAIIEVGNEDEKIKVKPIDNIATTVFNDTSEDTVNMVGNFIGQDIPYYLEVDFGKLTGIAETLEGNEIKEIIENISPEVPDVHGDSVYGRDMREYVDTLQTVMGAMSSDLIDDIKGSVDTNMKVTDMMRLAFKMLQMRGDTEIELIEEE